MEQIKILKSFLQICASCKKILNEQGFWEQIKGYNSHHYDVEFSHGICEDCLKELYPDICDKIIQMKNDDKK